MIRILSIGPDREKIASRSRALTELGYQVYGCAWYADATRVARTQQFHFVLLCDDFPVGYARQLAAELQRLMPKARIIILPSGPTPITTSAIEELLRGHALPRAA